jgi:hypothetical protein
MAEHTPSWAGKVHVVWSKLENEARDPASVSEPLELVKERWKTKSRFRGNEQNVSRYLQNPRSFAMKTLPIKW